MLGQPQSAVAYCTAAIRLSPRNSLIRYNRGIAYSLQGNMTRAALDFDTAIRLRPNYAPAYHSRAELYVRSGSPARAVADRIKAGQIPQIPSPTAYHQFMAEGMVKLPLSACGPTPCARTSGLN